MCGIAGIWHRDGRPAGADVLQRMADILRHRGPDGEGFWRDGALGFAHRRLKIIDVSERADQPMSTPDGRLVLVFNGEIHNYLELRGELEAAGIRFRSTSDTEVALWSYRHWGEACFERFNGMWAMAFWDADRGNLLLSRDRFGIKPLYYAVAGPRFAFASEAKALAEVFPEERRPCPQALHAFLRGAFPDGGEGTFFANIRQVAPGHLLRVTLGGEARTRYWSFQPGREEPRSDAEEKFRWLLDDAVRLRMRSDVPVGVLLSGGLDSSAVARLAVPHATLPLHAFSLQYADPNIDESAYARIAAGTDGAFVVHWIEPHPLPLLETMRAQVWHHDAPCPSRGRYPAWHLMRETARHVRVVLAGDGSDEMLAGYPRFILPAMLDRLRLQRAGPLRVWRELKDLSVVMTGTRSPWRRIFANPLLRRLGAPTWPSHQILTPAFLRNQPPPDPLAVPEAWVRPGAPRPYRSFLNNALWIEFTHAGLPETCHADDAVSMAFSVEARAPFLDHRIAEFLFELPFHEKIRDGLTKSLLRRALRGILPEEIRLRRPKLGFPAPLNTWFKDPARAPELRDFLLGGTCVRNGVFDRRKLARRLDVRLKPGTFHNPEILWRWLVTEMWFRDFIDRAPAAARPAG